jgi:hypothetical protein
MKKLIRIKGFTTLAKNLNSDYTKTETNIHELDYTKKVNTAQVIVLNKDNVVLFETKIYILNNRNTITVNINFVKTNKQENKALLELVLLQIKANLVSTLSKDIVFYFKGKGYETIMFNNKYHKNVFN